MGTVKLRGADATGALQASDPGLLGLLHPMWQALLGLAVVLLVVVAGWRLLARRGPSRMTRAVLAAGFTVVAVVLLSSWCSG